MRAGDLDDAQRGERRWGLGAAFGRGLGADAPPPPQVEPVVEQPPFRVVAWRRGEG